MKYTDNMPDRLHELNGSNFEIAKGQEDITGWDVMDSQRNKVGKVDDLVFDKESLKVRYIILQIHKDKDIGLDERRKVLIPIGTAELDKDDDRVYLPNMTVAQLNRIPDYHKDMLNRDIETKTFDTVTGGAAIAEGNDFYNHEVFNDHNLYKNRYENRAPDTYYDRVKNYDRDKTYDRDTNYDRDKNYEADKNYDRDSIIRNENKNGETTIPVIKENFEVGKRQEETGGIRIHKRVVDEPVEQKVNLREEHVKVDRRNVDRPATDADFDHSKDEDIEIREHAEVPVVNKEARVVEEIRVKKEVTEHDETVKGSVRNTEVHVDELEPHHDKHR
jgi:stress response protein YsnF/sporulation protein YlmC with PRC-barrel domain